MPTREQPLWLRILLNICGPLGTGLALLGYINAALGLVFLGGSVAYVGWEVYPGAATFVRRRTLLSLPVFLCGGLVIGLCAWLLILRVGHTQPPGAIPPPTPESRQSTPQASDQPPTMATLFAQDLPTTLKVTNEITTQLSDGTSILVKQQIYIDFDARTKFVGFYLPSSGRNPEKTYVVAMGLVNQVDAAFSHMNKNTAVQGGYRGEMEDARDLPFSGRVLLYHDDFLSIPQKADIIRLYEAKHYNVQFRGPDYLGDQIGSWHQKHDKH